MARPDPQVRALLVEGLAALRCAFSLWERDRMSLTSATIQQSEEIRETEGRIADYLDETTPPPDLPRWEGWAEWRGPARARTRPGDRKRFEVYAADEGAALRELEKRTERSSRFWVLDRFSARPVPEGGSHAKNAG